MGNCPTPLFHFVCDLHKWGHPLAGRCQASARISRGYCDNACDLSTAACVALQTGPNARRGGQVMLQSFAIVNVLITPVTSIIWLRTESRQSPIRIKRAAMLCSRPSELLHPRRTLVPRAVQWKCCTEKSGCRLPGSRPLVARHVGDADLARVAGKIVHSDKWLR
jgi:hypothetical protein